MTAEKPAFIQNGQRAAGAALAMSGQHPPLPRSAFFRSAIDLHRLAGLSRVPVGDEALTEQ